MTHPVTEGLALAACGLLLVGAVFQLALCVGAPWASAAYGGRAALADGRLPGEYRIARPGQGWCGRHPVEGWGTGAVTACLTVLRVVLALR